MFFFYDVTFVSLLQTAQIYFLKRSGCFFYRKFCNALFFTFLNQIDVTVCVCVYAVHAIVINVEELLLPCGLQLIALLLSFSCLC